MAEGFCLIGRTQAAAEVKDSVVIVQGQSFQKTLQFLKTLADLRWIGFVGFGIGLVELVENGFSIAVPGIKGMVVRVGFQCFGKGLQDNTSKKVCVMLPWKCGYCKSFLKNFRMSNSIGAGERILEQRNLWWCESEHYEQHTDQTDCGKGKLWVLAL